MSERDTFLPKFAVLAIIGSGLVFWERSVLDPYALSIVMFVGINIILAVSLNISNGFTGLFSLGHPAFMTVSGYMTAILVMPAARKGLMLPDLPLFLAGQEWSFLPTLLCGGLLSALVAVIAGFPVLRLRGHYLAVATLGLIFIIHSLAVNLDGITRGALGLSGLPAHTTLWWVYGFVLLTLFVC